MTDRSVPPSDGTPDESFYRPFVEADPEATRDESDDLAESASPPASDDDGLSDDVRAGSPFRESDEEIFASAPAFRFSGDGSLADYSPSRYTAWGACIAAATILVFAALCAWLFPAGGLVVSGIGVTLAIIGSFSPQPKTAVVSLLGHIGMFVACFLQIRL